jgi:xylulokinase
MTIASGNPYVLAIDLGTSGAKVGLVSSCAEILGWEFEPTPLLLARGGAAEQRPDDWWAAIRAATHRLLDKQLVPVEEITALSCTTQWAGTVAVDAGGEPLANAIIWLDTRGARYVAEILRGPISVQGYDLVELFLTWLRLSGGAPARNGKDPIGHILFLKHERPEIYRQAALFLAPKDYINLRLTGKAAASFDSIAMHWLTDNRRIDHVAYDPRLFRLAGLERERFPELRRATDVLDLLSPQAAVDLGLSTEVQVIVGSSDMHTTAIGSGAVYDFEPHLYLGTSSWVSCHVPFKKTLVTGGVASVPSSIPNRYLVIDEQEWAAGCLNYVLDEIFYHPDELATGLRPDDPHEVLNRVAADAPPGSERLIFTPWLYGERTPVDDAWVRGGFVNLSPNKTRAHLARAVFEGVAYNTRWMLEAVERFVKRRLDGLHLVGGGAVSDLWCQILADVLDREIHQMRDPRQAPLRGAACLALMALGTIDLDEVAACVQIQRTFQPKPENRQIYNELFREFVNLYKALRPIYTRLNAPK